MKRSTMVRALLASMAVAGTLSTAGAAHAQELELTGPLKGAPAARHMRLYREGRFEIAPTASFTLLDEYRRTILFGARLNYNLKDWFAIGVWGAFGAISSNTNLATEIDNPVTGAPRDPLTANNVNHTGNPTQGQTEGYAPFTNQTAKMNWILAPQVTFIPFRGKLAIFNKIFVDADLYAAAGWAFTGIQERGDCGGAAPQPACSDPSSFALVSRIENGPTAAVGFTFFPGDFWSIGVEYRGLPFNWNRAGFDSRGTGTNGNFPDGKINSQDETFKFNQMITISVGFYLPTKPTISE
jgi:opacity protein-like surface antigen